MTSVAVVVSAARGRRYLHSTEPLLEELAEGAAESAVLYGLDETAGLPGLSSGDPAKALRYLSAARPDRPGLHQARRAAPVFAGLTSRIGAKRTLVVGLLLIVAFRCKRADGHKPG